MRLITYLQESGVSQRELAKRLDIAQGTLGHWLAGRIRVPAERCHQIVRETGGLVRLSDLRPDLWTEHDEHD